MASTLANVVEPAESTAPAQRSFSSGFAGSSELFALEDLARTQAWEIIGLPSRRRDLKATVAKNCNGDRADTPAAPVTITGPLLGVRPAAAPSACAHDDQAGANRATGLSTIGKL